jgi:hypothetical protein
MNFDILEVFTRAGKITWKYKILWLFGMLASCGRGGNGGNSNSSDSSGNGDNPFSPEMTNQLADFFSRIETWFDQNTWIIFAFIAFVLIMIALQIFLSLVGTAGLARGVVHAENGVETLQFGELFSESLKYFWRLFWSSLIIFLPVFLFLIIGLIIFVFSIEGFTSEALIGGSLFLFFIAFCCCLFPISILLNLYNLQVSRAILIEDLGVFPALSRGWDVLTKNIIGLIVIGVVLFILSFIIGIIISLPTFLIVVPLMFSLIDGNITSWQPFILAGVFLLCYSPIAWFLNGVLITYTDSVWTLVYLRVTKPKDESNTPILSEANA